MTVFDNIKNKNIDEIVEWLDKYCYSDLALWWIWWDKNYCNKCELIKTETNNFFGYTKECAYCELNNNCKFFKEMDDIPSSKQVIKMWLESEVSK